MWIKQAVPPRDQEQQISATTWLERSSHYQVLVAQSSIEVHIMSSQETPTSHLPTWGTLSFKHNLWFGTNFSKVNLLNSNTYSFLSKENNHQKQVMEKQQY